MNHGFLKVYNIYFGIILFSLHMTLHCFYLRL